MWKSFLAGTVVVCAAVLLGYAGAAVISTDTGQFALAIIALGLAINGFVEARRMIVRPDRFSHVGVA